MRYQLLSSIIVLAAIAIVGVACGGDDDVPSTEVSFPDGNVYIALGDSIAAGSGASDASTRKYVALVAEALRGDLGEEIELVDLAVGGATTQSLIDEQLPTALERLRQGDVRLVTLTISGNDLNVLQDAPVCIQDPAGIDCPLDDVLLEVEQRLNRILGDLREASPDTVVVFQAYPNLFSGTGNVLERPADIAFDLLNGVIIGVAERNDVLVADPRARFAGQGGELTHLLDPTPDPHPNDAGHRIIADAFIEALGLAE